MRTTRATTIQAAIPLKQFFNKALLFAMISFSLVLLASGKANHQLAQSVRTGILDQAIPVLSVLSRPIDATMHGVETVGSILHLHATNLSLQSENTRLQKWQHLAKSLEAENQALKQLLNFVPAPGATYISARIVGGMAGPHGNSAIITAGTNQGIAKGQAVVNDNGLIGRIIETGERSARVLMLTDVNSRIPVITENSRYRGMLAGNNGTFADMLYLPKANEVTVGETLVTSGDGGAFPAGVPVGKVVRLDNGKAVVQPFIEPSRLEYINVVDYHLTD